MPERDPIYLRALEKLGFNMTRMRWKLLKLEQRREALKHRKVMPERLRWLGYRHKICRHCGALNDKDAGNCCRCKSRLPSLLGYRVGRFFGFMIPQSAPLAILTFFMLSVFVFGTNFLLDGFSAILAPSGEALFLLGGLYIDGESGHFDWWRVMTFGVVHGGIIHIAFNCYAMTVLSGTSEVHLGPKRTLVLITASQLGAAFATWYWYLQLNGESVFTVGASGWVSGLLGYALVYTWSLGPAGARYRSQLIQWGVYILLFGFFMGANNAGHIGGALAGAVVGYIQNRRARTTRAEEFAWEGAFWTSAAVWLICFAAQALYFAQHIGQFGAIE